MRKFSADQVFPVAGPPVERAIVVTDDDGAILEVAKPDAYDPGEVEYSPGVLIPGFVNAHCHLELSHMKGMVDTGTGLIPFITNVVQQREASREVISAAIRRADEAMYENGIVAVGDISNVTDSFDQKFNSRIRYYTFVEMFDFLQDEKAEETFAGYKQVFDALELGPGHRKAIVPHSPYTVSGTLFQRISEAQPNEDHTISIHNQEMEHENALFRNKSGALVAFYERFGISLDAFQPIGAGSIAHALDHLNPGQRIMFVHNTLTTQGEIAEAQSWGDHVYWVTCPNANLYIENRLPDYSAFRSQGAKMAIGTDSLTSNWQLSVLEEMKTIARYQSYVPFAELLQWATLNGAEALGFDDQLGSLEPGKAPGLCHLNFDPRTERLHSTVQVRRLI